MSIFQKPLRHQKEVITAIDAPLYKKCLAETFVFDMVSQEVFRWTIKLLDFQTQLVNVFYFSNSAENTFSENTLLMLIFTLEVKISHSNLILQLGRWFLRELLNFSFFLFSQSIV